MGTLPIPRLSTGRYIAPAMSKWTFRSLTEAPLRELEKILAEGTAPDPDSLVGWEFRGWNVVLPVVKPVVSLLGIQRFAKGFYRVGDEYRGYNVDIQKGGVDEPWTGKPSDEAPVRRAFFQVYPPGEGPRTAPHDNALFLRYEGRPKNGLFDGGGLYGDGGLRDYVVLAAADNPDLLVGKAYYRLPPFNFLGGFFIAERLRKYEFHEEGQKEAA